MRKKTKKNPSQLHVEYSFLLSFQPNASLATSDSPNAQQTPRMSGVDESPRPQAHSYASCAPTTPQAITSPHPQSQSYASGTPTKPQAIMSPRPQSQSYASGTPTKPQAIMSPRPQSQSYASGAPTTPQAIMSPHIVASDTSDSDYQYEEHMLDTL